MTHKPIGYHILAATCLATAVTCSHASPAVVVLDFELNDVSLLPGSRQELQRTRAVAPLLREALAREGAYELVVVAPSRQQHANAGAGYLSDHPDSAAELGREFGADWIVVGRLQKSNDLFAYLSVDLIDVHAQRRRAKLNTEIKGPVTAVKLTQSGVQRLARQISQLIDRTDVSHVMVPKQ